MHIIKQGNLDAKKPTFTCKNCGCEFECSESEYWTDSNIIMCTYPAQYKIISSCPCCHKICTSTRHIEPINISVTGTSSNDIVKGPYKDSHIENEVTWAGDT